MEVAFQDFIDWAFRNPDARRAFELEKKFSNFDTLSKSAKILYHVAFIEWAIVTQWGEAGSEESEFPHQHLHAEQPG
jgi:hypothetical protein